jgi:predicted nucleotidyltransferase
MRSLNDIKDTLAAHREKLVEKYPIRTLAIFGSYSRNEQKENSDLDILVEFSSKIGIKFVDLAEDLENILGQKVDLVSKNGIKEKYYKRISTELVYV